MVVHYIVEEVKKIKGRFLKQDRFTGKWYELDERQAKEKVGHAIRDATSSLDPKKKGGVKKSRSNSSTVSAASSTNKSKKSPFRNQQPQPQDDVVAAGTEISFVYASSSSSPDNNSSSNTAMVYDDHHVQQRQALPCEEEMDISANSMDHHRWDNDDLEPLNVDSVEAQNSMTELQRDSSFLHRLSVSLVDPNYNANANANAASSTTEMVEASGRRLMSSPRPFRYEVHSYR